MARRMIQVGDADAIACSNDKKQIYKVSFKGKEEVLLWTLSVCNLDYKKMELFIENGEVGVLVSCSDQSVIQVNEKEKSKIVREFKDMPYSGYSCKNIAYADNKKQMITIGGSYIQCTSIL